MVPWVIPLGEPLRVPSITEDKTEGFLIREGSNSLRNLKTLLKAGPCPFPLLTRHTKHNGLGKADLLLLVHSHHYSQFNGRLYLDYKCLT